MWFKDKKPPVEKRRLPVKVSGAQRGGGSRSALCLRDKLPPSLVLKPLGVPPLMEEEETVDINLTSTWHHPRCFSLWLQKSNQNELVNFLWWSQSGSKVRWAVRESASPLRWKSEEEAEKPENKPMWIHQRVHEEEKLKIYQNHNEIYKYYT